MFINTEMIFSDHIFFYNVIVEMLVNLSKELPLNYREKYLVLNKLVLLTITVTFFYKQRHKKAAGNRYLRGYPFPVLWNK